MEDLEIVTLESNIIKKKINELITHMTDAKTFLEELSKQLKRIFNFEENNLNNPLVLPYHAGEDFDFTWSLVISTPKMKIVLYDKNTYWQLKRVLPNTTIFDETYDSSINISKGMSMERYVNVISKSVLELYE